MAGGSAGVSIPEDLLVGVVHRGELLVLGRMLCPRAPVVRGLDLAHRGIERSAVEIRAHIGARARAGGIPKLAPQFAPSLVEEEPGASQSLFLWRTPQNAEVPKTDRASASRWNDRSGSPTVRFHA